MIKYGEFYSDKIFIEKSYLWIKIENDKSLSKIIKLIDISTISCIR